MNNVYKCATVKAIAYNINAINYKTILHIIYNKYLFYTFQLALVGIFWFMSDLDICSRVFVL